MNNKKGIQLSVNFMVMIIIAVIVFVFGLSFLNRIIGITDDLQGTIPEEEELALTSCLNEGKLVCLPKSDRIITKLGQAEYVGLGINNDLGSSNTFYYHIKFNKIITEDGTEFGSGDFIDGSSSPTYGDEIDTWYLEDTSGHIIENKENDKVIIPITTKRGDVIYEGATYVFDVIVCTDSLDDNGLPNPLDGDSVNTDCNTAFGSITPIPDRKYGTTHKIYLKLV